MTLSTLGAVPSKLSAVTRSAARAHVGADARLEGRTVLRSLLLGALGLLSFAGLATIPMACSSGGVGDPCTPEDEYSAAFGGFTVDLDNIESRSFQCSTRICLVNHFQGRVSCPLGQGAPTPCTNPGSTDAPCTGGATCELSQIYAPACVQCAAGDASCTNVPCPTGLSCTPDSTGSESGTCTCTPGSSPTATTDIDGISYLCQESTSPSGTFKLYLLQSYLCHVANNCQTADGTASENANKDCCVPGTDNPVGVPVCGQCTAETQRDAPDSVYCSCRCCAPCCSDLTLTPTAAAAAGCSTDLTTCGDGNPTGNKCDPNFNFCSCPNGFTCAGIRPDVDLGDKELTGAYCVKQDTAYTGQTSSCTNHLGYPGAGVTPNGITCQGTASSN